MPSKPTLLLHMCCAPCATAVVERLSERYAITAYFYDPNIHPRAEYENRKNECEEWIKIMGLIWREEKYDAERWFALTAGYERAPERGERCGICYAMRMERAASFAAENKFNAWTTILSVSPHKDFGKIKTIGEKLAEKYGVKFLAEDFKKQNGFLRSLELSKQFNLRRQNYCGCVWSKNARFKK